ncbi:MAG: hypothetical protein OHK0040_11800 [bacterium]
MTNLFDEKRLKILRDVRSFLIRLLAITLLIFLVTLFFVEKIMRKLNDIIKMKLILYSLPEAFMSYLKLALFISLLIVVPYIIIEVVNLLNKHTSFKGSKNFVIVIVATLLFYAGAAFCYFIVLPSGIKFLLQYQTESIKPMIALSSYISFVFTFVFTFGIMFELPLFMFILGSLGLITVKMLNQKRRFFILGNSILSAILTPTPDVFNMLLMMVPLQVLYEVGIIVVLFTGKQKLQKNAETV